MKRKIIIALFLICIVSIPTNVFQFYKIEQYSNQQRFYTVAVESDFKAFITVLDYYDGKTSALSNESAIKNSVSAISSIRNEMLISKYKDNRPLSEMLMYLDMFLVMESDEYINKNINSIKPQLTNISKNLNDEKAIIELNFVLKNLVSNK